MKDHEIPKVQINIVTFRESSCEVDGIHLSIPTNIHESSWFDSLGLSCLYVVSWTKGKGRVWYLTGLEHYSKILEMLFDPIH